MNTQSLLCNRLPGLSTGLMEISNVSCLTELRIDDHGFIHQWPVNSLDDLSRVSMAAAFGNQELHQPFSQSMFDYKRTPELKTDTWNSCNFEQIPNPPLSNNLHLVNSNYTNQVGIVKPKEETWSSRSTTFPSDSVISQSLFGTQNYMLKASEGAKRICTNARLTQPQDHIIAERKRREKLSQRFIALSALVPGLKKMDKVSVLGDAIKYLKQLQDQVKNLEEQTRKKSMESVVFVKKYELCADGESSSSEENFSGSPIDEPLPEIEARFSDKEVLIRVHCERKKGILDKIVAEIEKLHLTVVNSSAMSFGDSAIDITIIAQMDEKFTTPLKDFMKNLRSALLPLI
ncbi:transcription factor bHLH18-like isoform X1 [Olea europaea var. sylvestris]|uniref:transcription factor bHLH18-like isoform X1 n=1 Tax=Olea europaea var. sylvestris TaxID=158386 RepID=UPI000C1CE7E7|nr:transcription factor bHLH18-like isoform X1 [Olea europaea var. sylvestris]